MFGFLINIFNALLYRPLFNLLIVIYNYLPGHDFGLAIIALTIVIRFLLYPLAVKGLHSQVIIQKLQPKVEEIQKKYKDNKEKQAVETLELYRKEKISPFSGFFLVLIQLPILIALYRVFSQGLKPEELVNLYSFVSNPKHIDALFLGSIDLSASSLILAILAGIIQFFQTKMMLPNMKNSGSKEKGFAQIMQKQMVYFFPFITVLILLKLPSALGLYWVTSGIFSIIQQYFILKKANAQVQTS